MAACSNQNLWKILTGHSSIRDSDLILAEVEACSKRFKEGLVFYKSPSKESEKTLRATKIQGSKVQFILEVSKNLDLDQMLSSELFQAFLEDSSCQGGLAELSKMLGKDKEQQKLLTQLRRYYTSERRHLLRCIKHLFGFWQDSSHPYRETYEKCVDLLSPSDHTYIENILKQYETCALSDIPSSLKSEEEQDTWLLANLREQCELLEIVLVYHKDYYHRFPALLQTAKTFQKVGFGFRCNARVSLLPAAKVLLTHISHLCTLILLEAMDLEHLLRCQEMPDKFSLSDHAMADDKYKSEYKALESLVSGWGDMPCHAPILLAWTILKFVTQPGVGVEQTRLLGNRALQSDVFGYMNEMLASPFFSGNWPVSGICKSILQVLLSCCVTAFSEESLGDPKTLISMATKCLSHPPLRLEFWCKGTDSGAGLLLGSALRRFPLGLTWVLGFLEPLAQDEASAHHVFRLLQQLQHYSHDFTQVPAHSVDVGEGAGSWIITNPLSLYPRESWQVGLDLVLEVGTEGVVFPGTEGAGEEAEPRQVIQWSVDYSAWDLFALLTCSVLHSPGVGIDSTPSALVGGVASIAKLVTQVLKHGWSLEEPLRPITSQYFTLLQKFSPMPHPPCLLLAECLKCVAVMAANSTQQVWEQLSRTGFLPHINIVPSTIENLSVSPGHYGQLMNSWERPRGIYPVSMAMLDLLLCGFPPVGSGVYGDSLACVVLVMREMFAGSHSWRYRHSANRDQIGHKLLQLCHMILSGPQDKPEKGYSVWEFVHHFLLHSVGGHSLLGTLSLSLDTANALYASRLSESSPVLQVEALKIAFDVIDLLLLNKNSQNTTALEQALATQSVKRKVDSHSVPTSVHLVAVIASYVHHRDDSHVPAGAIKLLRRLSQVSPMSVFACLGAEAVAVRDALVHRLRSHVEDVELKVGIVELITECVYSQPGMMELFLSIQPAVADSANKVPYELGKDSCLHVIMKFISDRNKTAPTLLQACLFLLRCLWAGRHDAALIALRGQTDFWTNLTHPLLAKDAQDPSEMTGVDFVTASHLMYIIALEVYYVVRDKMDGKLVDFLQEFSTKGCYKIWMQRLCGLPPSAADSAVSGQLELSQAWSTFLCVATSQPHLFRLSSHTLHEDLVGQLLCAVASQLDPAPPTSSSTRVRIAEELSMLCVILVRKWLSKETKLEEKSVESFVQTLTSCSGLDAGVGGNISLCVYSSLVQLLSAQHTTNQQDSSTEHVEMRYIFELIPLLDDTFKKHSFYLKMEAKHRPDIVAVYVLKEMLSCALDFPRNVPLYLEVLKQHSVLAILASLLGEHLHTATDLEFVSAVLGFFISLSSCKNGSEALLTNKIDHYMNISLANALSRAVDKKWAVTWRLSLRLMSSLLSSLSHQFLDHALDFVGVYQKKIVQALDIYHVIQDLASVEETRCVSHFLFQLSPYKQQFRFSMPALHAYILERVIILTGSAAALVSRRATLKQVIKTMNASGVLEPEDGPLGGMKNRRGGRARQRLFSEGGAAGGQDGSGVRPTLSWEGKLEQDDSWVATSPAYSQLQDGLVSILTSCLATLRHYCPPLGPMLLEGGIDLVEYAPLFSLSLAPPTIEVTTPPSLATLTTCLSAGVDLMNKMDPPRAGTPSRSPVRSPSINRSPASLQKRAELLGFLEQAVVVLLSQATRYLIDPALQSHDKLQLKKELANELSNFTADLHRNFTRKGAPSPVRSKLTPPTRHTLSSSLHDSSVSGKSSSSQMFSDTSDQAIFKLADSFSKQFFR